MNSRVKQAQKEGATRGRHLRRPGASPSSRTRCSRSSRSATPREVGDQGHRSGRHVPQRRGAARVRAARRGQRRAPRHRRQHGRLRRGASGARPLPPGSPPHRVQCRRHRSTIAPDRRVDAAVARRAIEALAPTHRTVRCKGCSNACLLTVNDFGKDEKTGKHRRFITGNRCEKGESFGKRQRHRRRAQPVRVQDARACSATSRSPRRTRPRGSGGHPARAEHVRELPVLVHVLHAAGLARGADAIRRRRRPTRRASSRCRPRACAIRPSSATATS